jgi:hypothetical protein
LADARVGNTIADLKFKLKARLKLKSEPQLKIKPKIKPKPQRSCGQKP